MNLDKHFQWQWAQIRNINNSGRNAVSVHSAGAENQMVSLHTDLDFFLQFGGKKCFHVHLPPPKETGVKVPLQPSALSAVHELEQARMEPPELLPGKAEGTQGVSLKTRFCRLIFSSHTGIKILWETVM